MKTELRQPEKTSRTIQSKTKAANQAPVQKILQRYQDQTLQMAELDEDELLQGKFETVQREILDDDELLQGKFKDTTQLQKNQNPPSGDRGVNNTGLPDNLKTGIENLSGFSMDDVRVHYNSDKPAQLQALAYTQGTDIHVAPGQEKHLPHEAWHVVQQKQGRVQPTTQLQGVNINDNKGLEREADVFGTRIVQLQKKTKNKIPGKRLNNFVVQAKWVNFEDSDVFIWDKIPDGLRWFLDKKTDKLLFKIEFSHRLPDELIQQLTEFEGKQKTLSEWLSTSFFEEGNWGEEENIVIPGVIQKQGEKKWLDIYAMMIEGVISQMHTEYKTKTTRKTNPYVVPKIEWDDICIKIRNILTIEPTILNGGECMILIDELLTPLEEKYLSQGAGIHAQFTTSRNFLAEICVAKSYWLHPGFLEPWTGVKSNKITTPDFFYYPLDFDDQSEKEYADTFVVQPSKNISGIYSGIINTIKTKAVKYIKSKQLPFTVIINISLISHLIDEAFLDRSLLEMFSEKLYENIKIEILKMDNKKRVK